MDVVFVVVNNCTLDAYNNQNTFCFCIAKNKKTAHRCKPMRCAIVLSYLCLVVLRTKLTHSFGSAPHLRFAESGEFFLQTIAVVRL